MTKLLGHTFPLPLAIQSLNFSKVGQQTDHSSASASAIKTQRPKSPAPLAVSPSSPPLSSLQQATYDKIQDQSIKTAYVPESHFVDLPPIAKPATTPKEHAAHALSVIFKKTLTPEEADQVTAETSKYWANHINSGFLKYRKSVANESSSETTSIDWSDPYPGTALFADARGRLFIDCLGGFGIFNLGHRHPAVVQAVEAQMKKQCLHSQELLDPLRSYCGHLLSLLAPGNGKLNSCFFTNSGTESVEACLKMALLSTGRKHIISTINAFHGKTLGSLSCTSKSAFRAPFLPLLHVSHVPFNDLNALRTIFSSATFTGDYVAAFIVEPIQGEGGIYVATNEYLREARRLCDQYGACLIFDEVQTGMGRTGSWWGCDQSGVVPDLMAIGKGFGGGVMPAGAIIGTAKIWEKYVENPFVMTTTFGGNPLSLAAAIATINVLLNSDVIEDTRVKGAFFKEGLEALKKEFPTVVKEVRGRGLMLGLEFLLNDFGVAFSKGMFDRGVLVSGTLINAQVVRIEPPLVISREQIQIVLDTMSVVCREIQRTAAPVAKL